MSLAVLADHMASKGRGPDSMLIHMSPREVQGLQALAMKHGGSLTINPETGLPEAGFLDKLLPAIIGFGISYVSGGTIDPKTAAMIVGGVQTARTGDIGKGIQAGLGAYGGAGIGAGMTAAGTEALGSQAAGQSYLSSYAPPGVLEGAGGVGAGLSADMAYNLGQAGVVDAASTQAASVAQQAAAERIAAASPFEKLSAGAEKVAANPMSFANKDNFKYLAAAAAPVLADQAVKSNLPVTATKPGYIRPYSYDPYGGTYTAGNPYEAVPTRAASGGVMGFDESSNSPMSRQSLGNMQDAGGMFNFAHDGGGVMKMASGGITSFAIGGDTKAALEDAYGAGDYDAVNNIISQNKITEADVGSTWKGFDTAGAAGLGVNYFAQNKDVADAYANNNYGMSQDDFAQAHYDKFGQAEGRTFGGTNTAATNTAATNTAATNTAATTPVTDTGGGLAALNTAATTAATTTPYYFQVNPDVAAEYARNPMGMTADQFAQAHYNNFGQKEGREFVPSAAASYAAANNQDLVANTLKWIDTNPFATSEQINAAIKGSGMSTGDVNRALDSLVASGKISGSERYYIQQGKGLSAMADSTAKWLKEHPNATQADIDAVLKAASMDTGDAQQVLAHGFQVANDQMAAASKYIQDNPDVARWITSDQGKAYVKEHPEFDAQDIAWTHYTRYGEKEGRKWGLDKKVDKVVTTGTGTTTTTPPITYNPYGTNAPSSLESILNLPPGVSGAGITTVNPNGTITTRPNIPGIPEGGFTGMTDLRDAYTKGGGSLGYIPYAPKTIDEFNTKYKNTGGSKAAYDYLMGKAPYSPIPVTPTGEIQKPYWESVGRFPENRQAKKYVFVNGKYELNPDYVKPSYVLAGEKAAALTNQDKEPVDNPGAGKKWVWNSVDKKWEAQAIGGDNTAAISENDRIQGGGGGDANGGLMAGGGLAALTMAGGGMSEQFNLGGYSDGGRLLRGPGDGVSDSIPATIGNKRPARLADGEFVVPARIVSELGNGSTEAGARKLYAMMDRVQAARKGSIGKGKVAKNSRADKYLPA